MYAKTEADFEDDFDRNQEISRSAFADMLHDTERNQKYSAAVKEAIDLMHKAGRKANVLEIGTGTGLLAMLSSKHGADSVTTIEAFGPISDIALKIIELNGFKDKINVIQKHSTKVVLGEDLKEKGNILVTELFDTELIGEGAIKAYDHAHEFLMEKDCIAVPTSASVFIQIVESPLVASWQNPKNLADLDGDVLLTPPKEVQQCFGSSGLHDIQLSQFPNSFKSIIQSTEISEIDFSGKAKIPENYKKSFHFKSENFGLPQAIFFWWELKMNPSGSIRLSCAPYWNHPEAKDLIKENSKNLPQNLIPWRDHWMQAIYHIHKRIFLNEKQDFFLTAYHDEFSWWFDLTLTDDSALDDRPTCDCLYHCVNSRTRIAEINDSLRTKSFMKLFDRLDLKGQEVIVLGDNSLLGLSLVKLGVKTVYILEENPMASKVTKKFIEHNKLEEKIKILENLENPPKNISLIFSEPHFLEADLCWDNITELLKRVKIIKSVNPDARIIPQKAEIFAVPVHFLNFYKIRHPLKEVEGFDHRIFDEFVENSSKIADRNVESFSLWEYPCKIMGEKTCIFEVDFNKINEKIAIEADLIVDGTTEVCNGLAMWMNWQLDKNIILKGGLLNENLKIGNLMEWNLSSRQGVHLIPAQESNLRKIKINSKLNPDLPEIFINFSYEK